jgi:hypothetical protein
MTLQQYLVVVNPLNSVVIVYAACFSIKNIHILPTAGRTFSQLLNVHSVSDVKQIEIHTAEPLVAGPSYFEVEISVAKLRKCKLPDINQILAELIQAEGETLSEIPRLMNYVWNKEELPDQW